MKTILLLLSMSFCILYNANAQNRENLADRIKSITKEKDPEKNVISLFNTIKDYNLDTIKNAEDIDVMKGTVALSFLEVSIFPKFEAYIQLIKNKFNQTSYLNMAADMLFQNNTQPAYAELLAQKTVDLYDAYKNDPLARPTDFPIEDWNRFMKMAAYPYYETYAKTLHQNGKNKMAFLYQEKALENKELEKTAQSSIELYTTLLESEGYEDKAYKILLKMANIGKASINMNMQLKRLYIKRNGNEANASLFLDSIQNNVGKTYKIEIAKKMFFNINAPDFTLLNLKGEQVSLSNFRGKVVVLDFWATWCAPCIASMPAMEKLSKQHPEVVFLFIATRETGAEAESRVKSYIKKSNFSFNVLMDAIKEDTPKIFPVARDYKLKGIPAKVVIDKHGKLRFLTEGYSSDAELTHEMEAMIDIAKEQ